MNKVLLIGNTGNDPDTRYLDNGNAVGSFSLATSESYTNKQGEKVQQTEWHKIVVWGKTAEIAEKYVKKGMKLAIEGKIKYRNYENKEGQKVYVTEIYADRMEMLSKSESEVPGKAYQQAEKVGMVDRPGLPPQPIIIDEDDDLPF